jgi:nucleotide-binding universal stress UspA family protein
VKRIVVGVDGSDASKAALAWAGGEAELRGTDVLALLAWMPTVAVGGPWPALVPVRASEEVDEDAEATLAAVVDEVLGEKPKVDVVERVVHGAAAPSLVEASGHAELLVVGSRGLGGFTGMLLGSVSHQCAQHASCPVVIVRRTGRGEG